MVRGGVVSPGGVGFDISCGVRLLVSEMMEEQLATKLPDFMDALDVSVPRGVDHGSIWPVRDEDQLREILVGGSRYAVERGYGVVRDVERYEDRGAMPDADPAGSAMRPSGAA